MYTIYWVLMQEAFKMKRIVGLIMVFCLVFSLFAEAMAEPKWEITEQTKAETNEKKKTVTLTVKVKGKGIKYQWVFVNPEKPEDTVTGKNLPKDKRFKGVKISGYTKNKVVLSKIPDALNGWKVYCHLYSNAYKLDTEPVVITVPGQGSDKTKDSKGKETKDSKDKNAASSKDTKKSGGEEEEDEEEKPEDAIEPVEFTVRANGKYLYKADSMGNPEGDEAVSSLTFTGSGNVVVKSADPFKSWSVNGVRFEPETELNTFKLLNISGETSISLKAATKSAASAKVDESISLNVTCKGCTFTYLPKGLKSVTEGSVPSGAVIFVVADNSDSAANGYSINGGEAQKPGASSIQVTVTQDTEIVVK